MRWNSSTYALRQSKTSTLLPFLYQTRTLKSAPLVTRKSCRNPIQPGVNVQGVVLLHSKRHYAARSLVYDEHDKSSFVNSIPAEYPKTSSRKPKPASRHSNASIPFEHSNPPFLKDEFQDSSDPRGNAGPRSVSLTEKEKRIFEKLFKKVEREEKGKDNDKVNANTSERAQTGDPLTSAPLSAHFNHLIATHEKDPLADLDHRSKSPRSSEEGSDNSVSSPSPEETSTTARSFLSSYLSAVATAPTDAAIWSLLQSDIFPLIKAILPPTPEPTPAPQPTSNEKSSSARSRRIDRRKAAKGSSSAKNQTDPIPSDPPSSTEESIQPPPSPPLTDYKSNDLPPIPPSLSPSLPSLLPPLFTLTLRHLRLHFHLSPYPFLLLPHLHTHISPLASHLITSTPFYNELLYLTFSHQPLPLHGMISLLDEMRNNGIEGDEVTLGILNVLKRKRDRVFRAGGRVEEEEDGKTEGSSREKGVKDKAISGSGIGDGIHDTEKKRQRARWMWWRMSSNSEAWLGIREKRKALREEVNEKRSEVVERGEDADDEDEDEDAEFDGDDVEAGVRDNIESSGEGTRRKVVSEQPVVML